MNDMTKPKLRFPEFKIPWKPTAISTLLEKQSFPVDVDVASSYRQIGVRSHGKGIFHKECVTGAELGEKRVFHVVPGALVVNIVFAWEQAVALTTEAEAGFVASHRFPMFTEKDDKSYLPFIRHMFLTKRGKRLLEMASPGGAGRNKTLGQQEFMKLKPIVPTRSEQRKIADTIDAVDAKLVALAAQQTALTRFKSGLIQRLFSQELRFTQSDGAAFPDWEQRRLGTILHEHKSKSTGNEQVFSVSVHKGLINQIEHLGRSFSASDTSHYNLVKPGDVVYTKSPTGNFPLGIVKQSQINFDVIVSPLYGVFTPETFALGFIIDAYFQSHVNVSNYLTSIVQKGAKNTISVTNNSFLSKTLLLPVAHDEQNKIADALSAIDRKVEALARQITSLQDFKRGLLQQMFV